MFEPSDIPKIKDGRALAEDIEAARFGVWFSLLRLGQGHLAHMILVSGYNLLERIRAAGFRPFYCTGAAWDNFCEAGQRFATACQGAYLHFHAMAGDCPMARKIARIKDLVMAVCASRPGMGKPVSCNHPLAEEIHACKIGGVQSARAPRAETTSPTHSPCAGNAGSTPPDGSGQPWPSSTTGGGGEPCTSPPSEAPKGKHAGKRSPRKSRSGPYVDQALELLGDRLGRENVKDVTEERQTPIQPTPPESDR